MAVKIRLKYMGKKDSKFFRIVVADESAKRDGKIVESLGYYDPKTKPETIKYYKSKLNDWIKKGATMTIGVSKVLQ
jgi:small subunit ribosomal protein S16